jgi:hypothetical protein
METYLAALAFTLAVAYGMAWSRCQREKARLEAEQKLSRREMGPHGR